MFRQEWMLETSGTPEPDLQKKASEKPSSNFQSFALLVPNCPKVIQEKSGNLKHGYFSQVTQSNGSYLLDRTAFFIYFVLQAAGNDVKGGGGGIVYKFNKNSTSLARHWTILDKRNIGTKFHLSNEVGFGRQRKTHHHCGSILL
jgi:hypothetical protein